MVMNELLRSHAHRHRTSSRSKEGGGRTRRREPQGGGSHKEVREEGATGRRETQGGGSHKENREGNAFLPPSTTQAVPPSTGRKKTSKRISAPTKRILAPHVPFLRSGGGGGGSHGEDWEEGATERTGGGRHREEGATGRREDREEGATGRTGRREPQGGQGGKRVPPSLDDTSGSTLNRT
jgi:hypothetical protein